MNVSLATPVLAWKTSETRENYTLLFQVGKSDLVFFPWISELDTVFFCPAYDRRWSNDRILSMTSQLICPKLILLLFHILISVVILVDVIFVVALVVTVDVYIKFNNNTSTLWIIYSHPCSRNELVSIILDQENNTRGLSGITKHNPSRIQLSKQFPQFSCQIVWCSSWKYEKWDERKMENRGIQ